MSASATAPSSGTNPTVLVVGFDADQILRKRYEGRVAFNTSGPEAILKPEHIHDDIEALIMRSGVLGLHQERIQNLCKAGGRKCRYEVIGSLPILRDRLQELFESEDVGEPTVRQVVKDEPISDHQKILRLECRPGTQSEWVRDNMTYPCNPRSEARRLFPMMTTRFPNATEASVYSTVRSLLERAGLLTLRRDDDASLISANPAGASEAAGSDKDPLEELLKLFGTFSADFMSAVRAIKNSRGGEQKALRDLRDEVRHLQELIGPLEKDRRELHRMQEVAASLLPRGR